MGELANYHERPFPLSDIPFDANFTRAQRWLERCEESTGEFGDTTEIFRDISSGDAAFRICMIEIGWTTGRDTWAELELHDKAIKLCAFWDLRPETGDQGGHAQAGYYFAHTLALRSNVLPVTYRDPNNTLDQIKGMGRHHARSFAQTTWSEMYEQFPNTAYLYGRLKSAVAPYIC